MKNIFGLSFRLGILILVFCACGCGSNKKISYELSRTQSYGEEESGMDTQTGNETDSESTDTQKEVHLVVYVCGAVVNPGVYELEPGSRICHAVKAAGGFLENADQRMLNLADQVSDGQQILVLTVDEAQSVDATAVTGMANASGKVNLNRADREELMTLPGIGESKAEAILAYRDEMGAFRSIEEIMNITGIKEGVFDKIKDQIEV